MRFFHVAAGVSTVSRRIVAGGKATGAFRPDSLPLFGLISERRAQVYMSCTAGRQKPPSSATNRNPPKPCAPLARWSGPRRRRRRAEPSGGIVLRAPPIPPQCPECCGNPRLLRRGTGSSNPSPSSGESANFRFLSGGARTMLEWPQHQLVALVEVKAGPVEIGQAVIGSAPPYCPGVLDLDSPFVWRFDEIDHAGCEQLVALFVEHHQRHSG